MLLRCLRLAAALALAFSAAPRAQETAEDPDVRQGDRITLSGLVQSQFNTSSVNGTDDTEITLRRVRLGADARVSDRVSGRVQAELANAAVGGSAELNEAYALVELAPAIGVLIGKGGRPFGYIDATAAANLVPIERGARVRGADAVELYGALEALAYAGRSVGVQVVGEVDGTPVPLAYAAGYFAGSTGEEGRDADIRQFAARVQAVPLPGIQIGVAATSRAFASDQLAGRGPDGQATGADPAGNTRRGAAYAVDVEVGEADRPGLFLAAELATGTLDPFSGDRFVGAQGWLAWRVAVGGGLVRAVQPLARASWADADGPLGDAAGTLLTPGVNVYLAEGTRLMLNADVFVYGADAPSDAATLAAFRAQFQISF